MLVSLGRAPNVDGLDDLVATLRACHARIRHFVGIAQAVSATTRAEAEVVEAAHAVARYFRDALPLHVRDEDDSLAPRLRGTSPTVDAALATMAREHAEHDAAVAALLDACATVCSRPGDVAARAQLGAAGAALDAAFGSHLALEERVVFPVVAAWPAVLQAEVRAEMRQRRP